MRKTAKVLIIEDNRQLAEDAQREITDFFDSSTEIDIEVAFETDFDAGLTQVRAGENDVVVLDVRRDVPDPTAADEIAGRTVYRAFREARFAPVVFWTALPDAVKDEQMIPLVTVVSKEDMEKLPAAIESAISSRALSTISTIEDHVATVLRKHMWDELAPYWREYTEGSEAAEIAPVLLSRLARVLEDERENELTARPSHRYVYPPTSEVRSPGDILRASDQTWWVTLTPACDFAQNKVDFVLLSRATAIEEHPKYKRWAESNVGSNKESDQWESLRKTVLTATNGRYHYLPAFREVPDLVIDLEDVRSVSIGNLQDLTSVASLVSPFAEALLVQHSHYRGRIGVPDFNSELVKQRLLADRQVPSETGDGTYYVAASNSVNNGTTATQ